MRVEMLSDKMWHITNLHTSCIIGPLGRWLKRCANMFSLSFYDLSSTFLSSSLPLSRSIHLNPSFIYIQKFSWWLNFNDTLILTKCYHVRCQMLLVFCPTISSARRLTLIWMRFFRVHKSTALEDIAFLCFRLKPNRTFAEISHIPKHFLSIESRCHRNSRRLVNNGKSFVHVAKNSDSRHNKPS